MRNEISELISNSRTACFEILLETGELQRAEIFSHYDRDTRLGELVVSVNTINQSIGDYRIAVLDMLRSLR